MEEVVIVKTDDVVDSTWYYGMYGAFLCCPSFSREVINIRGRGDYWVMTVLWDDRLWVELIYGLGCPGGGGGKGVCMGGGCVVGLCFEYEPFGGFRVET
jgi:hypothetical protein